MPTNNPKPFTCSRCKAVLGERVGDVLATQAFALPVERSRPVICSCGEVNMFKVDRRKKKRVKVETV